jgi:WD40 repeat protein
MAAPVAPGEQESAPVYDAFVSYSRVDKAFAKALARALESYKAPKDLALPQRHLKIFRDEEDFTGVEYFAAVRRHLADSSNLILVCSPSARRSSYVNDEIRRFAECRGAGRIIPVLYAGIPNNEASESREAEKAFPEALCELMQMPLAVSYAGFDHAKDKIDRGAFENSWYTLLANLFGLSRNDIEQRDKRRQARQRRLRNSIVAGFILTILTGLVASLYYWRQAVVARDEAFSRELAANSLGQVEADPDLSVKLALEAWRVSPTRQAEAALRESLTRHRGLAVMVGKKPVRSAELSSDGRLFATGGDDKVLRLWDVGTGTAVAELTGHTDLISDVSFSPDDSRVATASWDNTARIWDVAGKRLQHELPNHGAIVTSVRFSPPDGQLVATSDGAGKVRIWEAAQGKLVRTIEAHSWDKTVVQGKTRIAFSPDGSWLLSSAGDSTTSIGDPVARVWQTKTGAMVREFPSSNGGVIVAALFSRSGKQVLIGSTRDDTRVWDIATGKPSRAFAGATGLLQSAAFSDDGRSVLTSDTNGNGAIWDVQTGAARTQFIGRVDAAAFDPTGERVAASDGEIVRVWDARSGTLLHTLRGHQGDVDIVRFGRVPQTLITAGEDGTARVWSLRDPPREVALALRDRGDAGPLFNADGGWVMARSPGRALIWEAATGKELAALETGWAAFDRNSRILLVERALNEPQTGAITSASGRQIPSVKLPYPALAESRGGALILTADDPFLAVIRDSASWRQAAVLKGHQGEVTGAVFDHESRWVFTVSSDSSARVWEIATGKQQNEFRLRNRGTGALMSADGRLVCALEDFETITVWETGSWRKRHEFSWEAPASGGNWVKSAAFSPDSARLAAGDDRGVLRVFDLHSGKTIATLQAHTYEVSRLMFSADGRLILTTGKGDRGARLWDAASGKRAAELGTEFLEGAAFSPDGTRVATLSSEGIVRLYNWQRFAPVEQLVALAFQRVKRDWTPGERQRYLHEPEQ